MSPPTFDTGENVQCYHGHIIYVARILKRATDANSATHGVHYFVHYQGWKKTWDEWVPPSRLLKDTEMNRARHRDVLVIVPGARSHLKHAGEKKGSFTGARRTNCVKIESPNKISLFANPTKSSTAKAVVAKTPARVKPPSAGVVS
ncbi:chromo domain-like protein, partial [Mycena olivaceomarginata]